MSGETPSPVDPRVNLARDRTGMATYRTELALDRTTLAWIRTTLTMANFGFGMVAFFRTIEERSPNPESLRLHQGAIRMRTALILLGIVATVLACLSHWSTLRRPAQRNPCLERLANECHGGDALRRPESLWTLGTLRAMSALSP
jgi:uncharacterized membrane protein YidH (DUF202 family)